MPAKRGFAVMSKEKRSAIASLGGKAVSKNRKHMSRIGRAGGIMSCHNRLHRLREADKAKRRKAA